MSDTSDSSSQSGYAGWQGENDGTSEFNQIAFVAEQIMARLATMKLVKIMSVTTTGALAPVGFVDVLPLVNQVNGLKQSTPHGTVYNIPYFRLQGGKNAVIIDPQVDDIGYVVVADRDISAVKTSKKQSNPGSFRQYSLSDGVYVGGILNGVPEQYVQMNDTGVTVADKNGNKLEMKVGGNFFTGLIVAQNGIQVAGDIHAVGGGTYAGNFTTTGNIRGAAISTPTVTMDGHIHPSNGAPPTPGH